jgi:hypothetical protein
MKNDDWLASVRTALDDVARLARAPHGTAAEGAGAQAPAPDVDLDALAREALVDALARDALHDVVGSPNILLDVQAAPASTSGLTWSALESRLAELAAEYKAPVEPSPALGGVLPAAVQAAQDVDIEVEPEPLLDVQAPLVTAPAVWQDSTSELARELIAVPTPEPTPEPTFEATFEPTFERRGFEPAGPSLGPTLGPTLGPALGPIPGSRFEPAREVAREPTHEPAFEAAPEGLGVPAPVNMAADAAADRMWVPPEPPRRGLRALAVAVGVAAVLGAIGVASWVRSNGGIDVSRLIHAIAGEYFAEGRTTAPRPPAEPPAGESAKAVAGARVTAADAPLGVVTEAADVANTVLANRLLGGGRNPQARFDEVAAVGWAESLAALAQQPRVTIARYDALQAARSAPAAARLPPLQVVAPIAVEPLFVVVLADSAVEYLHQLRGLRINTGAPGSSRAQTAEALYQSLFGEALPPHRGREMNEVMALERLGTGGLDAVLLIGSAANHLLAQVPAANGRRFRLLAFDPNRADAQKALAPFQLVHAAAGALGTFPAARTSTLGAMSFVVTARPSSADAPAHERAMAALAADLCSGASRALARAGGAARDVDPSRQFEVNWPYSRAAAAEFARCSSTPVAASGAAVPDLTSGGAVPTR